MAATHTREIIAPGLTLGLLSVVAVRTPTLPPATHTNAVVLGRRAVVVLDPASPWDEEQQGLADALADVKVTAIFLSHHHLDHVGGAVDLAARTGAPILAHPLTAARVDFPVDRLVHDGDILDIDGAPWTALHTPGHASGHLCLHQPDRRLIVAGDMVAGVGTIVLDPPEGQLAQYLDSLARLRALSPALLLPAHGPAITEADAILDYYIQHRHQRSWQVTAALNAAEGPARPEDLVPHIYGELSPLIAMVAARQVLCHLQWLAERGLARLEGEVWSPAGSGVAPVL